MQAVLPLMHLPEGRRLRARRFTQPQQGPEAVTGSAPGCFAQLAFDMRVVGRPRPETHLGTCCSFVHQFCIPQVQAVRHSWSELRNRLGTKSLI